MTEKHICVHDWTIKNYKVDFEKNTIEIIAETVDLPCNSHNWDAKIIFSGVISHIFENINDYQNMIYDIDKYDSSDFFNNESDKKYFLNKLYYDGFNLEYNLSDEEKIEKIKKYLEKNKIFIFSLNSSNWMNWIILAKNMEIIWI